MRRCLRFLLPVFWVSALVAQPCAFASGPSTARNNLKVAAVETFLADIAQNIAGERVRIRALLPIGADPHAFQPTPADMKEIAESNVLIINGAGFEEYLYELLKNLGGSRKIIDASAGLNSRSPHKSEPAVQDEKKHHSTTDQGGGPGRFLERGDPHLWLSAANVVHYVENIKKGLIEADPGGAEVYEAGARGYTAKLEELDQWILDQVKQLPEKNRFLVTDHDEFGYFADRYGFTIVGMVVPSISSEASPSARQTAELVEKIRKTGVKAIFLEAGEAPRLANQVAREAGIQVVTGLYTHSISKPAGPAPNYLEMMRYDTLMIVNALK